MKILPLFDNFFLWCELVYLLCHKVDEFVDSIELGTRISCGLGKRAILSLDKQNVETYCA